jgi:putative spermidine/putrescine transport system substrate-binding protein
VVATKTCSNSSTRHLFGKTEDYVKGAIQPCGVGFFVWSTVLAYNADKLASAPTSWADFWDTKKFPGKRGLRKGAKYTLEFALMADGVAPKDVYKVAGEQGWPGSRVQETR